MLPRSIWAKVEEDMYPNPRLFLIGTVHSDPLGYGRALKLLDHLRPKLVTVEISAFSVRYRADHGARWRRLFETAVAELPEGAHWHPALRRVAAQIAMPFEWRAAHVYGQSCGAVWRPIDLSAVARQHLPLYATELLDPKNLRSLWEAPELPLEEQVAAEYQRARLAEMRPLWRPPTSDGGPVRTRERTMAARLRKLAHRGHRVVHLGGWEHQTAWEDGGGLPELLKDLQPLCLLLDEGDTLSEPESLRSMPIISSKDRPAQVRTPVPPGLAVETEALLEKDANSESNLL